MAKLSVFGRGCPYSIGGDSDSVTDTCARDQYCAQFCDLLVHNTTPALKYFDHLLQCYWCVWRAVKFYVSLLIACPQITPPPPHHQYDDCTKSLCTRAAVHCVCVQDDFYVSSTRVIVHACNSACIRCVQYNTRVRARALFDARTQIHGTVLW